MNQSQCSSRVWIVVRTFARDNFRCRYSIFFTTVLGVGVDNKYIRKDIGRIIIIISMSDIGTIIPYVATSLSVISRCVFMLMLYVNKSTKSLSLVMCVLGISSSCMWMYYSLENENMPLIVRSSLEISLQSISAVYIIRNKLRQYYSEKKVSCDPNAVTIMQLSPYPIAANTQSYHLAVDAG